LDDNQEAELTARVIAIISGIFIIPSTTITALTANDEIKYNPTMSQSAQQSHSIGNDSEHERLLTPSPIYAPVQQVATAYQ